MIRELLNKLFGPKTPICKNITEEYGAIRVGIGFCPRCEEPHNDGEEPYWVEGVRYPKCFNETKGHTDWGQYHDWDELHCCEDCGTKYWFGNGYL